MDAVTRRDFLAAAAVSAAGTWMAGEAEAAPAPRPEQGFRGPLCLFSKHLPDLDAKGLGRAVKALGFTGVDLTVRKGGHVAPERAAQDLPAFLAGVRSEGVDVPMITTGLVSASDPTARPILETAGKHRVSFFKPGYARYALADVRKELAGAAADLRGLADLAAACGVQLGYHNHAGNVGGPVWDIVPVIDALDPKWVGYYFDVRHAVVEGGDVGWRAVLNLVAPRVKMIAVKDFFWEKTGTGWRQRHCPLGEGMVDWTAFLGTLARHGFHGPLSLHVEYEIGGATPAQKHENTLRAVERDFTFLKDGLVASYGTAGNLP
jgi:L-ribulose-5-phosphate 3-epimerase